MSTQPIIALVGRPNVGKSTMFNRLVGRRDAITTHTPGTTRDRHFGIAKWFSHSWTIVDTAGILFEDNEIDLENKQLQKAMEEQVEVAVNEADMIALVVDTKEGLDHSDRQILNSLRKHNKPVIIIANKADNHDLRLQAEAFRQLGVDAVFAISAIHGSGLNDLIDYLIKELPNQTDIGPERLARVAIIGRPNVGKSTLMNKILGKKRMIVSDIPGTTRDSIQAKIDLPNGNQFTLIDTAGIRRRGKTELGIEQFSLFRTLKAINYSDIVILLLTVEESPTRGDAHVAMYAKEANKTILIVLNKADLAAQDVFRLSDKDQLNLGSKFLRRFVFMERMPHCFISARTGQGINNLTAKLSELIKQVELQDNKPIETP